MPHCGALSHQKVGWQVRAAPSNVANAGHSLIGCSMSRSIAWIHLASAAALSWERARQDMPELMHGLALTNFLDCNTRHVECSTCCVLRNTRPKQRHNNSETCRGTEWKTRTQTRAEYKKQTRGSISLFIWTHWYFNLCLYTVNSATLQRITSKQMMRNFERC